MAGSSDDDSIRVFGNQQTASQEIVSMSNTAMR